MEGDGPTFGGKSAELDGCFFPMVGKTPAIFSNHWKTSRFLVLGCCSRLAACRPAGPERVLGSVLENASTTEEKATLKGSGNLARGETP